ncbi:MAG: type IIL restriction-modification enzyme MmeI [Verrucomicrobiae bacterium]
MLFCLFAEDNLIFAPEAFTQFVRTQTRPDGSDLAAKLNELFDWLNNPLADGSVADTDWRYGFRYVNGGLFAERLGFPIFTKAMREALSICCDFQWAKISPAVFGSLFQGVLQDRARRQQGAHYTSERDIMKVIRSLFLDDLRSEWERLQADRSIQGNGVLDYVSNWYAKACQFIQGTRIPVAFVSTNSITQGEQAGLLWNHLFQHFGIKILFAHRTFAWASESRGKAHVHVVIVGFGMFDNPNKGIYDYETNDGEPTVTIVRNISPYLVAGPDRAVATLSFPLCEVPKMSWGNKPTDGGHFLLTPQERMELISAEPDAAQLIRPYMGGQDFLNNQERYCLWLKDAAPGLLRRLPGVMARVEAVRTFRLASRAPTTRAFASHPTLFRQIAQPDGDYLAVPEVSSENRRYIPIAYVSREVICANTVQFIPGATHFHFGVLTSAMHMAWMRAVCGRLKSDYRYSNALVYNNFPWPNPTAEQRARVETCAAAVLAAREPHLPPRGMSTLADLYDPLTMPPALSKAHADLDRAVERCYRAEPFHSDRERVEHLFRLYEQLTAPLLPASPRTKMRRQTAATTGPRPRRARTPGLPKAPPSSEAP